MGCYSAGGLSILLDRVNCTILKTGYDQLLREYPQPWEKIPNPFPLARLQHNLLCVEPFNKQAERFRICVLEPISLRLAFNHIAVESGIEDRRIVTCEGFMNCELLVFSFLPDEESDELITGSKLKIVRYSKMTVQARNR